MLVASAWGGLRPAHAQFGSTSHTVRVEVTPLHALAVNRHGVHVMIGPQDVVPGLQQMRHVDESTTLFWLANGRDKKITVRTDLTAPRFSLNVEAVNPTSGAAASAVRLSATPTDLITGIGRSTGSTVIRYTASARPEDGMGAEVHNVTFTITSH